jgi:hypothetical protein
MSSSRSHVGRLGLIVSLALALTAAVTAGTISPASAGTYPVTWTADPAPFPPDALAGSGGGLTGLSCPAVGWCVSIGDYDSDSAPGFGEGLIAVESSGGFTSVSAPLPTDASTTDSDVSLNDVSCGAVGACVVVGSYRGQDQLTHGLIVTLAAGTWSEIEPPMPPVGGTQQTDGAELSHVVCPTTDSCIATGTYTDPSGNRYAVVESASGSGWTDMEPPFGVMSWDWTAPVVACPSAGTCVVAGDGDADTLDGGVWSNSSTGVDATSVSCGAPGDCAAVGGAWPTVGSVATLSAGVWTTVTTPLPADALSPPNATVQSVSCPAAGSCVAVGYYQVEPSQAQLDTGFIDTLSGNAWTSVAAPLPAGSGLGDEVYLSYVSCPGVGQCVAAGLDSGDFGAVYENQVGDGWVPTQAPVPGVDRATIFLTNLSCPAAGSCADGLTAIPDGGYSALFIETDPSLPPSTTELTAAPTTPMNGQNVTLSATVSASGTVPTGTVTFWTGLTSLCSPAVVDGQASCDVPSWPSASPSVGASYSGNSSVAPSSSSTVFPLRIGTDTLPPAPRKVAYSTTLVAGGGRPPYTWSLSSGRLPRGLRLKATGKISGTPKTRGTFTFTVKVLDHRSKAHPSSTATQPLSITVP